MNHKVIFYLDNQSQELESENKELRWKCGQLEASLDLLRGSHTHNEKQVLQELHELRDRLEVSETAARSQKKILVKEVKTLRSQLDSVRDERDLYWRRLQVMREALVGTDGGSGGVSGGGRNDGKGAGGGQSKKSIASKVYSMKSSLF
jgi:chromosome segregation ATPase